MLLPFLVFLQLLTISFCHFDRAALNEPTTTKDLCQPKLNTYYTITTLANERLQVITDHKSVSVAIGPLTDETKWYFKQHSESCYSIRNKYTDSALTISGDGSKKEGASFELAKYEKKSEQHFHLSLTSDGCKIITVRDQMLLTYQKNAVTGQKEAKADKNQIWKLEEQICDPFPNQTYRIIHTLSNRPISAGGPDQTYKHDGNPKAILECGDEMEDTALFEFGLIENSRTVYYIFTRNTNKLLVVYYALIAKGTQIIENSKGSDSNQYYSLHVSTDGNSCLIKAVQSQRFLAFLKRTGIYKSGSEIVLHGETERDDELWHFVPYGWVPDPEIAYRIKNRATGKYLEIEKASKQLHTPVILSAVAADHQHQGFYFDHATEARSWLNIRSKFNGLVLDGREWNSFPLVQYQKNDVTSQRFKFTQIKAGNGKQYFTITTQYKTPEWLLALKPDNVHIYSEQVTADDPRAQWELLPEGFLWDEISDTFFGHTGKVTHVNMIKTFKNFAMNTDH